MCFVRDDSFNMERGYCELLVLLLINMIDNVLQHVHCAKKYIFLYNTGILHQQNVQYNFSSSQSGWSEEIVKLLPSLISFA